MNSWRDSYYVWFPLYSAARLERTDVHHIADTSPCCVLQLQQKQRGNLLIRTQSTVTTGDTRRPDDGGLASQTSWGLSPARGPAWKLQETPQLMGRLGWAYPFGGSVCVPLSSGSKLTVGDRGVGEERGEGVGGQLVHSEWVVHIRREVTTWTPSWLSFQWVIFQLLSFGGESAWQNH